MRRRETVRDYLDAAIGKALLGRPIRSIDQVAELAGDIGRAGYGRIIGISDDLETRLRLEEGW